MSQWWPKIVVSTHHEPILARLFAPTAAERDLAETNRLYDLACAHWQACPFSNPDERDAVVRDVALAALRAANNRPPDAICIAVLSATEEIAAACPELFDAPESPGEPETTTIKDAIEHREGLRQQLKYLENFEHILEQWQEQIFALLLAILDRLPAIPEQASTLTLSAPLIDLARNPDDLVEHIAAIIESDDVIEIGFFERIRDRAFRNMLAVNNHTWEDWSLNPKPLRIKPADLCKNHQPDEVARLVYGGTPFGDLLTAEVPLSIPEAARFEHMHVLAGTGHGKTQLLQHLIVSDLERDAHDIPSMVILDSQGDMIEAIKRLAIFDPDRSGSLADRLLIVDPSDVAFPPALNLFDVQSDRLKDYDQRDREQVLAGIIEIYDYIFGGLLGAELTQKQAMVFRFLAQLMLSIPGATIHTLRELLEDATPYMPAVEALPDTARGFFENHFFEAPYKATREQVLRRLYGVLQNPSFERMFAQPENRLDLFDTLNTGGIVLVNTAKDFLKSEASSIFGRYVIALTLKAAFERATLPRQQRRPTFLWIDEASEYFDDNIDNLLIQARKFNLGLIMAHQYLGQLSRNLPASLMTNTTIKLVGGVSDRDARALASEMRTSPEFLNAMTKEKDGTTFAAFVRNHTPHALRLSVPFGTAEGMERMSDESFEMLLDISRARLSSKPICQSTSEEPEANQEDEQGSSPDKIHATEQPPPEEGKKGTSQAHANTGPKPPPLPDDLDDLFSDPYE